MPLYKVYTDEEDIELVKKVILRGTQWALGPEIEELEKEIRNYVGCDYCVVLNSGTSALHATLLAYDIGADNEVLAPSFSFISTANAVLFVGATPKFVDIERNTYGLDPNLIGEKVSSRTKVVMPMDYGGISCDIFNIQKVAKEKNLILIEDAAEALGSNVKSRKVGSVADAAIFSFCGNKVLTTGEGGAVVTNSKEIFEKVKLIRSHGRIDNNSYFENPEDSQYETLGYNWRMSSLTASLGISQLSKLDKLIKMRKENANYLSSRLVKYSQIKVPQIPPGYDHIYQMYTIELENNKIRDSLQNFLLSKKIFCKVYFKPIHLMSLYMKKFGTKRGMLPVTEDISDRVLTLPIYPNMSSEEKEYLLDSISEFFESYIQ